MTKDQEVMDFLSSEVFNPILDSPKASKELKAGVRLTISRLNRLNAKSKVRYYWSAIIGTDRSNRFAKLMKAEGFTRFEEVLETFRERFNDKWIEG